jgi:antitoxin (DNA-binding transcriptional repressor) of toxin-antitoxin stability system
MFLTMNATMINIADAKAHLSEYAKKIKKGQRFVLCDRNKPFAEIRPLERDRSMRRPFGLGAGLINLPDDFNEPDPEIEDMFRGRESK